MSEMVERVARTLCTADDEPWDELAEFAEDDAVFGFSREGYRKLARAAVEEHKAALAEAGFVIVPREPTEAMIDCLLQETSGLDDGTSDGFRRDTFRDAYREMIAMLAD